VHFNDKGDVVRKSHFKRKNILTQFEEFVYDSTSGILELLSVFDSDSTLLRRFLFGSREEMSEKYIRYVYGVRRIEEFEDRFTGIEFINGELPSLFRFFDVNAFLYGIIKRMYFPDGKIRQEDWVAQPGDRLMRRFLFQYHPELETSEIWEYDSTESLVMHLTIGPDGRAPLYTVTFPIDSSSVNSAALSYSLVDGLTEGKIVWYWIGGKPDQNAPHEMTLAFQERTRGEHPAVISRYSPNLVDSALYSIQFTGVGEIGYPAREIFVTNVLYDVTPPTYAIQSETIMNKPEISLFIDESLSTGEIHWLWESGKRDNQSPHVLGLSSGLLLSGEHEKVSFTDEINLNNGSVYTLLFRGKDLAGNLGSLVTLPGILFDSVPPIFTWIKPDNGAFISSNGVSYLLSEELVEGRLTWRQVSGQEDSFSPHIVPITGIDAKKGKHQYILLGDSPRLVDGSVYQIEVYGNDLAGNVSDTVVISDITCDLTLPIVNVHLPLSNQIINTAEMVYTLSEDFSSARIEWREIIEDSTLVFPYAITLDSTFLSTGDHRFLDHELSSNMKGGANYYILVTGRDRAGNEARPFEINNIHIDVSSPVFSDLYPYDSTYVSVLSVSYSLSENLNKGEVTWIQVAGNIDLNSPHVINLTNEDLKQGKHERVTPEGIPTLQDGSIYDVILTGIDLGGNQSEEAIIKNVIFDTTPPEIELVYPIPNSNVSNSEVSYSFSKVLREGSISWKWIGGNRDEKSLHVLPLVDSELETGYHDINLLTQTPELVNGAVYSVIIEGTDFGGKTATSSEIDGIRFDSEAPTIVVSSPSDKSSINSSNIKYALSEPLFFGTIVWTHSGGEPDSSSPHIIPLDETELIEGEHGDLPMVYSPDLVDGSLYNIDFFGLDSAGNSSDTLLISEVLFDKTTPKFEVLYPVAQAPTRDVSVAYSISKDLSEGSVTWKWTGGSPDNVGEHVQPLSGGELISGSHPQAILTSTPPTLVEKGIYSVTFSGRDQAGNPAASVQLPDILYDATAPIFSEISPSSEGFINTTSISYTLSEPVVTGTVIWTWVDGREDPDAPHYVEMVEDELNMGIHENITLVNSPTIEDSSLYNLVFTAIDGAGNISDSIIVENVLYDITNPQIEVSLPLEKTYISDTKVSYTLSEDLREGFVTWERINGIDDPESPHNQSLTGNELLAGEHIEIELENVPRLVEGAIYSILFSGRDKAGNETEDILITNVGFDVTAPEFADVLPQKGSFVNHSQVSYFLSELLKSGSVLWIRSGGNEDPNSPHKVSLQGTELDSGSHSSKELEGNPLLQDGSLYSIQFVGLDAAGNISDTVKVDSVFFDKTSPQFTIDYPRENSYVSSTKMSYSLGEDLVEGSVTWERVGGSIDEISPHLITLQGEDLKQGEHLETLPAESPELIDGTTYRLIFSGRDKADNETSPIIINDVTCDATPPKITDIFPGDSIYVNHSRISYRLSESLGSGEIVWTQISGNEDPNSPHTVSLADPEKSEGLHENILLTDQPALQDGSVYRLSLVGTDLAGSTSDTVSVYGISFDATAPIIQIRNPVNNSNISGTDIEYHLSEELSEARVIWEWTGGNPDSNAPYEQILSDSSLVSGDHEERLEKTPTLVDGSTYSIVFYGTDKAGNSAETITISQVMYDASPPSVSIVSPQMGSIINNTQMFYSLSENLQEGIIVWTQVGGTPDPSSPHEVNLTGNELNDGEHIDIFLENSPELQDGSIYEIKFSGIDFGDNSSDTIEVSGIRYDITPPVFSVTAPEQNSSVNFLEVSYSLSEVLREGSISWQRISGPDDPLSPYLANLSTVERDSGEHIDIVVTEVPQLVDGVTYTIAFSGIDSAGNSSVPFSIDGITYDISPPTFLVSTPSDSSYQNHSLLTYSLSESLIDGTVTWTQSGGTSDGASPHVVALSGEELVSGEHEDMLLSIPFELTDGAIYGVEFIGFDSAGNEAEIFSITAVSYDITPPSYTISSPLSDSFIDSALITYSLNEELKEASFTWTRTGGENDPNSPHIYHLSDQELFSGDFSVLQSLNLISGSIYSISLQGTDLAGNEGESVSVSNVTFDNISPDLVVTNPQSESAIRAVLLSYTISETLLSGRVTWQNTGGSPDENSPYVVDFVGDELIEGEHIEIQLSQVPSLLDGAIYEVTFEGEDLAGNPAEKVVIPDVIFDMEPPVISLSTPSNNSAINTPLMNFELSEDLKTATVTWERVEGNEDPNSPYISNLTGIELSGGVHDSIQISEAPRLVDGARYNIWIEGADMAGNSAESTIAEFVLFDVSPPVIVANYPAPSSTVNSINVSYSLSEELADGTITWTKTGGSEDPQSPHVQSLSSSEKLMGDHQEIILTTPPILKSNVIYSIFFDGSDAAGNDASEMIIESVTFDNEEPELVLQIPGDIKFINEPRISYNLSETLSEGRIIWVREEGNDDADSPHIIYLGNAELTEGEHQEILTTQIPVLKDGTIYSISLTGEDFGGNQGDSISVSGILYDINPPISTIESPGQNVSINSVQVSYSISEGLGEGNATWMRINGNADPTSPHVIPLSGEELSEGDHQDLILVNQTELVDGTIYSFTLSGHDLAGNEMEEITINGIYYDNTPPQFSQVSPESNSYINSLELTYTLSETLSTGEITWSRISGNNDPASPYVIELINNELFPGIHENITLSNVPSLVSGTSYTIAFTGTDKANNQSAPLEIESVIFDDTPPVFTISMPQLSAFVNVTNLSYELSESLSSGTVTWTPEGGGNPLIQSLSESELEADFFENIELINPPKLEDGEIYDIKFEGMDLSGNEAEPVIVIGVTYDITDPKIKITLNSPAPRTFMMDTPVTLSNSEDMSEIMFTWTRESGVEDPNSPHNLLISETNLVQGEHSDVIIPGAEALQVGTVYTLVVTGKDLAGNESAPKTVESIDIIRELIGDWLSKTALITVLWSFREDGSFNQGVVMGTRISDQEPGKVFIDLSKRPFELRIDKTAGGTRYAIIEFTGPNTMRVTVSERKPKSWTDGDLFEFEYSQPEVP